ncbi:hypothetical protein OPT61_g6282 [Boeremia exigua]|uniref:Uncharacterized protein n=1 Tax=Boeremia exigua TaxID=749465 RepID=A0ACC2I770_9PLEO|nr:hypothetical protein OPT61_g6282 [Boeremia exigua]
MPVTRLLLEEGASAAIFTEIPLCETVAGQLAYRGHTDLLQLISAHNKAELNLAGMHSRTPLHTAALGGHETTFLYLASQDVDFSISDAKSDNWSAWPPVEVQLKFWVLF